MRGRRHRPGPGRRASGEDDTAITGESPALGTTRVSTSCSTTRAPAREASDERHHARDVRDSRTRRLRRSRPPPTAAIRRPSSPRRCASGAPRPSRKRSIPPCSARMRRARSRPRNWRSTTWASTSIPCAAPRIAALDDDGADHPADAATMVAGWTRSRGACWPKPTRVRRETGDARGGQADPDRNVGARRQDAGRHAWRCRVRIRATRRASRGVQSDATSDTARRKKLDADSTAELARLSADDMDLDLDRLEQALKGDTAKQQRKGSTNEDRFSTDVFSSGAHDSTDLDLDVGDIRRNRDRAPTAYRAHSRRRDVLARARAGHDERSGHQARPGARLHGHGRSRKARAASSTRCCRKAPPRRSRKRSA